MNDYSEHVFGYDIRNRCQGCNLKFIQTLLPHAEQVRSYDSYYWPTRFTTSADTDSINFSTKTIDTYQLSQHWSKNNKFIVHDRYSIYHHLNGLWDNVGNMLCRFPYDDITETVALFTVIKFSNPKIYCDKGNIFDYIRPTLNELEFVSTPKLIHFEDWNFLGYDIAAYAEGFILGKGSSFLKEIDFNANNFNSNSLVSELAIAIKYCEQINELLDNGPYLIMGVYEAKDVRQLKLI